MAPKLIHFIDADQVRDEVQLIRQEYYALSRGCRRTTYDLLARAAAVVIATTETPALAVSDFSLGRQRFAPKMEAVLCGASSQRMPRRLKRHAAVVAYLVTIKGISPPELPIQLGIGIGTLAREAAEVMRKRRRRRQITDALLEQLRLDIPDDDAWRMAAKSAGHRVAIFLRRQDNDKAPYALERIRFLGRRV